MIRLQPSLNEVNDDETSLLKVLVVVISFHAQFFDEGIETPIVP